MAPERGEEIEGFEQHMWAYFWEMLKTRKSL